MDNFSLSIIVPCFNEQDVIKKTYNEIIKAFCDCSFDVEIIFVNLKGEKIMITVHGIVKFLANLRVVMRMH